MTPFGSGAKQRSPCVAPRWQTFAAEMERGKIADIEMRNEAKARIRLADLSQEETVCLRRRLESIAGRHIARELGISQATVSRRVQKAQEKLKAVPAEMISSPEDSSYLFDLGKEVNLYSAPTPTGSALARERMKLSDAAFQKLVIN